MRNRDDKREDEAGGEGEALDRDSDQTKSDRPGFERTDDMPGGPQYGGERGGQSQGAEGGQARGTDEHDTSDEERQLGSVAGRGPTETQRRG